MSYHIIIIDDDYKHSLSVKGLLRGKAEVKIIQSLSEGLQEIKQNAIDLVLLDIKLNNGENGLEGLQQIKQLSPDTDVVMLTGVNDPKSIVEAIRRGAIDYLCKPFDENELLAIIEKHRSIREVRDCHSTLIEDMNPVDARERMLGISPPFRTLIEKAQRLKGHNAHVLIEGESGTGKELLARYIHSLEENRRRPFIAVNCAAIPDGLIESELFGFERGAFTGAVHRKVGKFELANNGDIFLDEISSLRPALQAKILRVIQEKEVVRVGGNTTIPVNFRVIAATNNNLSHLVETGEFRVDLYHRLKVVDLRIPPLRERTEDILLLTAYFLHKFRKTKRGKKISQEALQKLQKYPWPGNIRELENVIQSLMILSDRDVIEESDLPDWLTATSAKNPIERDDEENVLRFPTDVSDVKFKEFLREVEKIYIEKALRQNNGDKTKTAEALEMGRATLYSKLRDLKLCY